MVAEPLMELLGSLILLGLKSGHVCFCGQFRVSDIMPLRNFEDFEPLRDYDSEVGLRITSFTVA